MQASQAQEVVAAFCTNAAIFRRGITEARGRENVGQNRRVAAPTDSKRPAGGSQSTRPRFCGGSAPQNAVAGKDERWQHAHDLLNTSHQRLQLCSAMYCVSIRHNSKHDCRSCSHLSHALLNASAS